MNYRLERVKEVLKRELGEIINRELKFKASLVTVQDVDITADLKHCHVFVSAIGSEAERNKVVPLLEENRVMLQQLLARRVVLKYTPQLHFKLDRSVERGARIMEILSTMEIPEDEPQNDSPESEVK